MEVHYYDQTKYTGDERVKLIAFIARNTATEVVGDPLMKPDEYHAKYEYKESCKKRAKR